VKFSTEIGIRDKFTPLAISAAVNHGLKRTRVIRGSFNRKQFNLGRESKTATSKQEIVHALFAGTLFAGMKSSSRQPAKYIANSIGDYEIANGRLVVVPILPDSPFFQGISALLWYRFVAILFTIIRAIVKLAKLSHVLRA